MSKYTIKEPIYSSILHLFIEPLEAFRVRYAKAAGCLLDAKDIALGLTCGVDGQCWIWMPSFKPNNIEHLVTLSHEIIHYALDTLIWKGIHTTESNHEPLTYLHDWAFGSLLKKLKKPPRPKKEVKAKKSSKEKPPKK